MTEAKWLTCADPTTMLEFRRKRVSDRKRLLFACACCRRIWHFIPTVLSRQAVEVAERYADGLATEQERHTAWVAVFSSAEEEGIPLDSHNSELLDWGCNPGGLAYRAAVGVVSNFEVALVASDARVEVAWDASRMHYGKESCERAFLAADAAEQRAQSLLLRDLLGNPFHPIAIAPSWLTPTVLSLAQAAYDNRNLPAGTLDKARLAVLADALVDAGSDNAYLLNHCRQPGEHVRGCWAVDLLLGKE